MTWGLRLLPSWAPSLYPEAWSPGKGVGIIWALLFRRRPESLLPPTRGSQTAPSRSGLGGVAGRADTCPLRSLRVVGGWAGSACPTEGDSLDPEGSDLLTASSPHQASAGLSRAHVRGPLASSGSSPSQVPRHADLCRDGSPGRQRAPAPALRLCACERVCACVCVEVAGGGTRQRGK